MGEFRAHGFQRWVVEKVVVGLGVLALLLVVGLLGQVALEEPEGITVLSLRIPLLELCGEMLTSES